MRRPSHVVQINRLICCFVSFHGLLTYFFTAGYLSVKAEMDRASIGAEVGWVRSVTIYNLKSHKYVCITTYIPDTKSTPNPNHITKQYTIVTIQINIVTCPI